MDDPGEMAVFEKLPLLFYSGDILNPAGGSAPIK
jgi:hypothetical protein